MLDVRQKASATGSSQRELTAYVSHKYSKEWKSQAYVVKGFADGSPDWAQARWRRAVSDFSFQYSVFISAA